MIPDKIAESGFKKISDCQLWRENSKYKQIIYAEVEPRLFNQTINKT